MTEEFRQACIAIYRSGHGAIRTKSGSVVSGGFVTSESEWDDPNGDGCITLRCADGLLRDVYASQFDCLLEEG